MNPRRRWLLLGGLLTATLAAAAWFGDGDGGDASVVAAATVARAPARVAAAEPGPRVNLERLDARALGPAARDPFRSGAPAQAARPAPQAPPVIVAAPAPEPPPIAPPLPFSYMGKLASGDDLAVFLVHGERNLIVREGEIIGADYRVERIAGNTLTLTYLPLGQRQTLNIGEPN